VSCPREHIHGLGATELVAAIAKDFDIAGEGRWVTGDIAECWDFCLDDSVQEYCVGTLTGRVEYNGIEALAL
jgi:hypothetical protein